MARELDEGDLGHIEDSRLEESSQADSASFTGSGSAYSEEVGASMLSDEGHEIAALSSSAMRSRIEDAGAPFYAFPPAADFDMRRIEALFPELKSMPTGPEMVLFYMQRVFFDPVPAQHEGLRQALSSFPADVIIGDNFMYGTFPMLLGPRSKRPPIALSGTMFLHMERDDGAPNFAGLLPAQNAAEVETYARTYREHDEAVFEPARLHLNRLLASVGAPPLTMNIFDASVRLPDAFMQLTVPGFEYPRQNLPPSVRFVGTPKIVPNQVPLPSWAAELDGRRKVVLVTQGTFSNHDLGQLVTPALRALAQEMDMLVVVTTGGRPVDALAGSIPNNTRIAQYLPFEWILPKTDVFVTNGGYGSVNQALSFGVPIVAAGLSEDKADVNARVGWSGAGIDLATNEPSEQELRSAVRHVLENDRYRSSAKRLAREFALVDTQSEVVRIVEELATRRSNVPEGVAA